MKKYISFFFFLFSFFSDGKGQNLVPNPSFEFTNCCPTVGYEIYNNSGCVPQWFSPSMGSPDYFNTCGGSVPANFIGFQAPHSGVAYCGIYCAGYTFFPDNRREYVETELTDSLKAGVQYCIEFYVSLSDSSIWATDFIGAYLSHDSVYDYSTVDTLPYTPQIENSAFNIITDKINWAKISGTYNAQGGEKFITIGNFKGSVRTHADTLNGTSYEAYYYLDDVFVGLDCPVVTVENNLFVPSAFSPNGDGQNDILYVRGQNIKDLHFTIYDRIGEKVFETTDITKGWDATYKGEKLNSTIFVYYVSVTYEDETTETKKGDISLIR